MSHCPCAIWSLLFFVGVLVFFSIRCQKKKIHNNADRRNVGDILGYEFLYFLFHWNTFQKRLKQSRLWMKFEHYWCLSIYYSPGRVKLIWLWIDDWDWHNKAWKGKHAKPIYPYKYQTERLFYCDNIFCMEVTKKGVICKQNILSS